ncbi:MAG: hypothetical protein LBI94_03855 [Treponema sp.]|nr:hypothetical protein [Treponema sp.]
MAKNISRKPPNSAPYAPGEEGSIPPGLLAAAERTRQSAGRPDSRRKDRTGGIGRSRPASGGLRLFTGILAAIAIGLFLLIVIGTLYTLVKNPDVFPGGSSPAAGGATGEAAGDGPDSPADPASADSSPIAASPRRGGEEPVSETAMFTGIGRLRIAAGPAAVVLSIVFPYPAADRPFTEELAGKISRFRQIARDYFGGLSPEELALLNEQRAKAELLRRFNDELRLGSIELLLFDDYLILE